VADPGDECICGDEDIPKILAFVLQAGSEFAVLFVD
jgi:hypothetical protein